MKETIGTILRLILKAGGGALAAKGFGDEATYEIIIGAVITIFGAVWGVVAAKRAASNKPAPERIATTLSVWLAFGLLAFALTGCGTLSQPPTRTEQKYFDIKTNVIEVVSWVTNTIEATKTTPAAVAIVPQTNRVEEYEFTPNPTAGAVASTGAAVGSIWSPIAGGIAGAALTGIFSLWGLLRSRKRETANELTAVELGQIIETGRQVLLALPDGAKYEAAWKDWMVKHQAQTGVISQVAELVATGVDNEKARGAAQTIVNLIKAQPQ